MFGLNEEAVLHACLGHRGGKPAFAESGTSFRCRSEPAWVHRFGGSAVEAMADVRIFAEASVEPNPGDRVALNGRWYRIAEVQPVRGWRSVHHLEILTKGEGFVKGPECDA